MWHLNSNEPAVQNYTPGPALVPGVWIEYEIQVYPGNTVAWRHIRIKTL